MAYKKRKWEITVIFFLIVICGIPIVRGTILKASDGKFNQTKVD